MKCPLCGHDKPSRSPLPVPPARRPPPIHNRLLPPLKPQRPAPRRPDPYLKDFDLLVTGREATEKVRAFLESKGALFEIKQWDENTWCITPGKQGKGNSAAYRLLVKLDFAKEGVKGHFGDNQPTVKVRGMGLWVGI